MTPSSLLDDQEALANLYDQVLPSVVNIQVRARQQCQHDHALRPAQ
ncbi:MAG: hypothetical protein R2838_15760 [Caldilineaceae bacterium]